MPTSKKSSKTKTKKVSAKKTAKKTAKKAAKKSTKKATKKSAKTTKSTKSKKTAQSGRVMVCAKDKECFWTTDGQVLKDLQELSQALNEMKDEVYNYHVNKERNDFADWVEAVLADPDCAAAIRKSRKPATAKTVVVRHLKYYNL